MKENALLNQSLEFSIQIVGFYKWMTETNKEYVLSKQVLRSATSIGANLHEAHYAISKPDFICKIQIALKECNETEY